MTQNSGFLFGYTNIIANGAIVLVTIFNIVVYKFRQQQEAEVMEKKNYRLSLSIRQLCYCFSFYEMKQATSNFHNTLVIGKGGFGNVYRGTLEVRDKPTVVAIKRLKSMSNQGSREFRAEIEITMKSDVYSFGVVLLEILTGLAPIFRNHQTLVSWAHSEEHVISDIMDKDIKCQYTEEAASKAFSLALKCTSSRSKSRPDAKQVVEELEQLLASINLENINTQVHLTEKDLSKSTACPQQSGTEACNKLR